MPKALRPSGQDSDETGPEKVRTELAEEHAQLKAHGDERRAATERLLARGRAGYFEVLLDPAVDPWT